MPYSVESETALPWWLRGKESPANTADTGFNPWVGKILWRRKWLPTPVFLAGKFHGQRSLVGYAHGIVELDAIRHNLATKNQHSKTDVQRTCELHDITFPPISISLLPVNLKRKWLHALHLGFPRKTSSSDSPALQIPPPQWLSEPWGHRGMSHVQPVGGARWESTRTPSLKGLLLPILLWFILRQRKTQRSRKAQGFCMHSSWSSSVNLLCLSRNTWKKPPVFKRSQIRKRWKVESSLECCMDTWKHLSTPPHGDSALGVRGTVGNVWCGQEA